MASFSWMEEDVLQCCGNKHFAKELASASPFSDLHHAIQSADGIWFNKVAPLPHSSLLSITLADPFPHLLILHIDVGGWLEAFTAHLPIRSISPSVLQSLFFQSLSFLFLFWNSFNFLLLAGLGGPRKNNLLQWLLPMIPRCTNWWTGISVTRRSFGLCSSSAPLEGARRRSLLN
ncbi:hypothetical protein ZIOFF_067321 [Zingiber officinale]|uniref:Uncharacterized protein n=1 Tax=Zingiber officinale TaxID=94328 RepID=A0A8J5ESP8_ZINOF|nr:hypothetical protein ZIOFF_067321 [Zingiber officinale]